MLSVPSRSPKRCRHTVWPVEVVAATGAISAWPWKIWQWGGRTLRTGSWLRASNPASWRNASGSGSKIVW